MNSSVASLWIPLPGGTFTMGENADDKFANDTERPRHTEAVAPLLLSATPVTIGEFRCFRPYHEPGLPDDWPVAMVTWEDAMAYCTWLGDGVRLPTETEWEYAARAGTTSPYPWGDFIDPTLANYLYTEEGRKTGPGHRTPVASYPPNPWGIYDLCGNVCEWTADPWRPGYDAPGDPARRVLRGGAWDYLPRLLRVSWRDALLATSRRDNLGFRLAK